MSVKSIYLIGSLRNEKIPEVAKSLRSVGLDVFDDWFSAGPEADDYWRKHQKSKGYSYKEALYGPAATNVFEFDKKNLDKSDAAMLVMPAGRSGHLELGYILGCGKPGYIFMEEDPKLPSAWFWVAGIIEGEGSISLNSKHSLTLSVQSTDKDVIDRLLNITGRGFLQGPYIPHYKNLIKKPDKVKPQWRWAVSKREDLEYVLNGIYDLMSERRKSQIDEKLSTRKRTLDEDNSPYEFRWDVMTRFATKIFMNEGEMIEYFDRQRT